MERLRLYGNVQRNGSGLGTDDMAGHLQVEDKDEDRRQRGRTRKMQCEVEDPRGLKLFG